MTSEGTREVVMSKIKLVIPDPELKSLPTLDKLRLNLNGRKHKNGKGNYKRQLNQIRRMLR